MIDHVGFPVSDYARSKAFYEKALAPLGYSLVMEVTQEQNDGAPAGGFGADLHHEAVAERCERLRIEGLRLGVIRNRKSDVVDHGRR